MTRKDVIAMLRRAATLDSAKPSKWDEAADIVTNDDQMLTEVSDLLKGVARLNLPKCLEWWLGGCGTFSIVCLNCYYREMLKYYAEQTYSGKALRTYDQG